MKRRQARKTRQEGEQEGQEGVEQEEKHPQKGAVGHRSCYDGAATGIIFAVDVVALSILASYDAETCSWKLMNKEKILGI